MSRQYFTFKAFSGVSTIYARYASGTTAAFHRGQAFNGALLERYRALVSTGGLVEDSSQFKAIQRLDELHHSTLAYDKEFSLHQSDLSAWVAERRLRLKEAIRVELEEESRRGASGGSPWHTWLPHVYLRQVAQLMGGGWRSGRRRNVEPGAGTLVRRRKRMAAVHQAMRPRPQPPTPPRGVYLYGDVGCGKSMVMDLFCGCIAAHLGSCRRLHFHAAMLELHSRIHRLGTNRPAMIRDRLDALAAVADPAERRLMQEELEEELQAPLFEAVAEDMFGRRGASVHGGKGTCGILALDEMQVMDAFNAVAIVGVLRWLLDQGHVLVTTSNCHPRDLNKNGLQRESFAAFVEDRLMGACEPLMMGTGVDYRRHPQLLSATTTRATHDTAGLGTKTSTRVATYFWPLDDARTHAGLDAAIRHILSCQLGAHGPAHTGLAGEDGSSSCGAPMPAASATAPSTPVPTTPGPIARLSNLPGPASTPGPATGVASSVQNTSIPVMFGRQLAIPVACPGRLARFSFHELCAGPLGAPDYIALCQHFPVIVVTDVPVMTLNNRDQARRFITLIDEVYNHRCLLLCSAAAAPDDLCSIGEDALLPPLESMQFETDVEGAKLRRDVTAQGATAPLAVTAADRVALSSYVSGKEEKFAFRRAVSRLIEMQTPSYLNSSSAQLTML